MDLKTAVLGRFRDGIGRDGTFSVLSRIFRDYKILFSSFDFVVFI
jgi:hypothetical protein